MNKKTNKKHHWLLLLLGLICFVPLQAQKEKPAKNRQGDSMTFEGECTPCEVVKMTGKFEDDLVVKKDDTGESFSGDDFVVGSAITNPIAYVSGKTITLSGTLELDCSDIPGNVLIRGQGDQFVFESNSIPTNNSSNLTYSGLEASVSLTASKVDMIDLLIEWEVSLDNGTSWLEVGKSKNKIYVTWKEPLAELPGDNYESSPGYEWYETVYAISCEGAKGAEQKSTVIDGVWSVFEGGNTKRADGSNMHYYQSSDPTATVAVALIRNLDGQCYSWCSLFISTLKIQGIEDNLEILEFWVNEGNSNPEVKIGFLVKNWYFKPDNSVGSTHESSIEDEFTYTHVRILKRIPQGYRTVYTETYAYEGVPGQNVSDPVSNFSNHAVVRISSTGNIYDPSYGNHGAYSSLSEYEEKNIDGFEYAHFEYFQQIIDETEYDTDFNEDGVLTTDALVYMQFYRSNGGSQETYIKNIYSY